VFIVIFNIIFVIAGSVTQEYYRLDILHCFFISQAYILCTVDACHYPPTPPPDILYISSFSSNKAVFRLISLIAWILKRQCHEMDSFLWRSKHFHQSFLSMSWLFSRSFKSFSLPYIIINFYLLLWNYLIILKMLTETHIRISFFVIGRCSLVPTSHWLQGKWARSNLSPAAFGFILQNLWPLPVSIFQYQNRRFRVFEASYWKDFQN
jgi:hypothetical protein